jgi:hypothetical protein
MAGSPPRLCGLCGLPVPDDAPAVRCEAGFYPRDYPDLFQPDEAVGGFVDCHKACFDEAFVIPSPDNQGGTS